MQLKTFKSKITEVSAVSGLVRGSIEYEIKDGKSALEYAGPKITPAVWYPVLAFFREVNEKHHSECQVRLYVNTRTGVWAAWAYPQEARTGMSARELVCPDAATQREQFKDSDGWEYFGTVHHHCSGNAFQSGTDRDNEHNQDGLHITIGRLDSPHYDIHARFYFRGTELMPDLSAFWDIGEQSRTLLEQAKALLGDMLPALSFDRIARHQMTIPAPAETIIPEQWIANLIEVQVYPARHNKGKWEWVKTEFGGYWVEVTGGKAAANGNGAGQAGFQNGRENGKPANQSGSGFSGNTGSDSLTVPAFKRLRNAIEAVRADCKEAGWSPAVIDQQFKALNESEFCTYLLRAAKNNAVPTFDIIAEWEWEQEQKERQEALTGNGLTQDEQEALKAAYGID